MTRLLASVLLTLAQGPHDPAPPGEAPADAPVWVAGQTADVHVFRVSARFECPPDTVGGLVQVSISDTMARAEFSAEENVRRRMLTLSVPGKQLQGLRPELFCPRPAGAKRQLVRLKSKFTGQGVLVCRNAAGKQTTAHDSVALDAWVVCPPAAEDRPEDS